MVKPITMPTPGAVDRLSSLALAATLLASCAMDGAPFVTIHNETSDRIATLASVIECDASGSDLGPAADVDIFVEPGSVGVMFPDPAFRCIDTTYSGHYVDGQPTSWGSYKVIFTWTGDSQVILGSDDF